MQTKGQVASPKVYTRSKRTSRLRLSSKTVQVYIKAEKKNTIHEPVDSFSPVQNFKDQLEIMTVAIDEQSKAEHEVAYELLLTLLEYSSPPSRKVGMC